MIPLLGRAPRSVLLIGAHSDDIEIGCGATVRALLAAFPDLAVHWIVLSGGGARETEARAGAATFLERATEPVVEVHDFPDTAFPYEAVRPLKTFFRDLAGRVRPDMVFAHRRDDAHQDHRFVAELTWQSFRDHMVLEYEIPKYEGDLGQPNVFVPVSREGALAKARDVVATFATQRAKGWFDEETLMAVMRLRGNECASPTGYAEAFHVRKAVLL